MCKIALKMPEVWVSALSISCRFRGASDRRNSKLTLHPWCYQRQPQHRTPTLHSAQLITRRAKPDARILGGKLPVQTSAFNVKAGYRLSTIVMHTKVADNETAS
ncbi:hypothetical protein M758_6G032300 [Ceratodon purpureus]|uniref:Uncharacterized protein n=1 Tax=Ceratodon purpureus TaxID=3225 RepID=A0A8T0H9Z3_CERPU|nr:hypothetical protein KC19_6G035300 [Ceratodon purpureus]KAG0612494.1 hypothetical protein M758_6G032300 [Ceratodon purpureus]